MDFYITVPSGPSPDEPDQQTSWNEIYLEKPIELEGQYEVALVQSVFEDVFNGSLATINIFPPYSNMDMYSFDLHAKDGEEVVTVIKNLNHKISNTLGKNSSTSVPQVILNESTLEFFIEQPSGWQLFITNVDKNHLLETLENTHFRFKYNKFHHLRHFYVFSDLVQDPVVNKYNLLTNICLDELKSNVVAYNSVLPRYVRVKDNNIKHFNIEYTTNINSSTTLSGKIVSTLHFRKINGF